MVVYLSLILVACFFFYLAYRNFHDERTGVVLMYLGGYPGLKGPERVVVCDTGDSISFSRISIPKKDIAGLRLMPRSQAGNALAGAALGAIVAGPVGALIGGAATSGANNVIQLAYNMDGLDFELLFSHEDVINKYPVLKQMIGK